MLSGSGPLAQIDVTFEDGSTQTLPLLNQPLEMKEGLSVTRVTWDQRRIVKSLRVTGAGGVTVRGLALIITLPTASSLCHRVAGG